MNMRNLERCGDCAFFVKIGDRALQTPNSKGECVNQYVLELLKTPKHFVRPNANPQTQTCFERNRHLSIISHDKYGLVVLEKLP